MNDLNNHLFAAIERLSDEDLDADKLDREIKRCDVINKAAQVLVNNAALAIKAQEMLFEYGDGRQIDIPMLTNRE